MMLLSAVSGDQWYCSHLVFQYAPHPHEPEASDVRITSGDERRESCIMESPFQCSMKLCHHMMSERASVFMRVLNVYRTIVRPERMTALASCRQPTNDSRSLFLQHFRWIHFFRSTLSLASFWVGSLSSSLMVSSSMPRKVKHVVGPSFLWLARGT